MGMLRDKGLLDYGEKVSTYWPEFAQNGKENVTLADVMRMESGLEKFDAPVELEDLQTDKIKQNSLGKIIEAQVQHFSPDAPRAYHGITKDWITNEIFRRVEP